ncbi:MAG: type II toxin-antitoxin system VapC family toxin [Cyanophyceae cyanobacterium]
MTLLLDTHALIWFLEDDPRLPASTCIRIKTNSIVFVSIASLWEIAIKTNIGKLSLSAPFSTIEHHLSTLGITQLPITSKDLEIYLSLPLHHRDPFDRLLVAQTINHSLSLISQDSQLDAYPIQRRWSFPEEDC